MQRAGLRVAALRENPQYAFTSERAEGAARRWGVASASLLAVKDASQDQGTAGHLASDDAG